MPEILRARSRSSLVATIVALGLIASACGAAATESDTAASETSPSDAAAETTTDDSAADDSAADDSAAEAGAEDGSAAGDDATEGDAADDVAATENLFPDIDVVNIVDGSTVNLAQELGGGDKPVLLWFWAPH